MRVVIAGGTGFIGGGLARALAAAGKEVVVLTRGTPQLPPGITAAPWDGRAAGAWAAHVEGAYAVVNLAGANLAGARWTPAYKALIRDSRIRAGEAVAGACAAAAVKPRLLVQASAVGYYGSRGDEELDEDAAAGSGFLADVCRAWEASSAPAEAAGVRRVIARSATVLAPRGGAFPLLARPFRFFIGGPWGNGRQWFPWIHYSDEVAALIFLIDNEQAAGPYNLCAPEPLRSRELARVLGRTLQRPWWWPNPSWALRLVLGEKADGLLLASARCYPRRLSAAGFGFAYPTFAAAAEELMMVLSRRPTL